MGRRTSALDLSPEEFRRLGHTLVDRLAELLNGIRDLPVTRGESPGEIRAVLGNDPLPERGAPADQLLDQATRLLIEHSLFNGHPRFWGFITSSPAPLGALADLLGAAVNPNVGGYVLSPMATMIEKQAIRWVAELLGYPATAGGIMVSGGNMANMVGFLAARRARAPWAIREKGLREGPPLTLYTSQQTHTWIQKAADLFGLGLDAIRWIDTDGEQRMRVDVLEDAIARDREAGRLPFLVVGTAGSVSTGAIDPLPRLAAVCRREGLWFHVDGAYGAPAAALPEAPEDLKALSLADSVAVDPHKWLYAPMEAGCTLVRDPRHLVEAFAFHPEYYNFGPGGDGDAPTNFHEHGPQNSRGFRALKVWLGLRQAGREGYIQSIRDDIALTEMLHRAVSRQPELEPLTLGLSISTFRYVPASRSSANPDDAAYLNRLNEELVTRLQAGGEAFVSNAVVDGRYALRACIVNFRTRREDVEALPDLVARLGRGIANDESAAGASD
jgi:glutamate/tyrosine decarboxylase-like PLP-dependent enzyme